MKRKWLLYSPYQEVCYYFVCFSFSNELGSSAPSFSKQEGFSTGRKLHPRVSEHEIGPSHRACMREYLNLVVHPQHSATKEKLKAIIEKIVEVVSFLAQQNMAFCGHREEGISTLSESDDIVSENTGHFLATIRLLSSIQQF